MLRFIGGLLRPYRGTLVAIILAMLVETAMSLASPWPLKIILDNVVGDHKLTPWLHRLIGPLLESGSRIHVALALVVIAIVGAIASYIDNYYTESAGQWVAHDLRMRIITTCSGSPSGTTALTKVARSSAPSPPISRRSRVSHPRPRSTSSSISSTLP